MNLYFASTHADFFYAHYLAVISARKTQNVDNIIMICTTPPVGPYADLIPNKVIMQQFDMPDFNQLNNASWEKLKTAHTKDYIQWTTLYENGGIFIDLDTICIRDMSQLLGSFDVIATPRFFGAYSSISYESAVVIAKKNSVVVADTLQYALEALNSNVDKYQTTGPIAYTRAINNHKSIVGFPGFDVFSPRIRPIIRHPILGHLMPRYVPTWENLPVPNNCYIIHIYASTSDLTQIDKEWVASSNTMYANAVKSVLTESEWYV